MMQKHFCEMNDNSGQDLPKRTLNDAHKNIANIDVVVKDNTMSLVFHTEMGKSAFVCTGRTKAEFDDNYVKLEASIRKHGMYVTSSNCTTGL